MVRRYRYWVLALALLVVVILAGLWLGRGRSSPVTIPGGGASAADRSATATTQPARVEVVKPKRTAAPRAATFPGTVEGYDEADLFAKVTGYVSAYHVDIGDQIKAGQELAVISVPELDKQYQEAQSEVEADIAADKAAEARVVQARTMLEVARRQLERAKAQLELQEITFHREEELHAGKAITDEALDIARKNLQVAQADTATDEAKIAAAQAEVASAEAAKAVTAAQIPVAQSRVERLRVLVGYERIISPFDGIVARRWVDVGNLAQPGSATPLYTVQRTDLMRIVVYVPEYEVAYIGVGTPATIRLSGPNGRTFEGQVSRTASAIHFETRTMRVEVDLPNKEGHLLHGRYVEVTFHLAGDPAHLALPAAAVLGDVKDRFVYAIVGQHVVRTPVQTGEVTDNRVAIVAGLNEDALVVLNGNAAPPPDVPVETVLKDD